MENVYISFRDIKKQIQDKKNKENSPETLKWYEKISDMIDSGLYTGSEDFLFSILQFIETKEYITDKQKIAIEELEEQIQNYNAQQWCKPPF